jgi:5-methylcytosine-specific restriction endonuclease McrA
MKRKNNKKKYIPKERFIPKWLRDKVWKRDGGKCVYCGDKPRKKWMWRKEVKIEFGHFIPFSKGGHNCIDNLQLECFSCNRSKGANLRHISLIKQVFTDVGCKGCYGNCGQKSPNDKETKQSI